MRTLFSLGLALLLAACGAYKSVNHSDPVSVAIGYVQAVADGDTAAQDALRLPLPPGGVDHQRATVERFFLKGTGRLQSITAPKGLENDSTRGDLVVVVVKGSERERSGALMVRKQESGQWKVMPWRM